MNNESQAKFSQPKSFGLAFFIGAFLMIALYFISCSTRPGGKSWITKNGWTEMDLGNSNLGVGDFVNYNKQIFDAYGNPITHIHKTGHFIIDGNIITCNFDDEESSYKLEYKDVDGDWYLFGQDGAIFHYDDPSKRK